MRVIFYILFTITMIPKLLEAAESIIQTIDIAPVNTEMHGVSDQDGPQIPLDLWKGLSHSQISTLLKNLPTHQDNPTMALLQKNLMMASIKTPASTEEGENILKLRILQLEKSWHIKEAYHLAKGHPQVLGDDLWGWLDFSYYLQMENYQQALTIIKEYLAKNPESALWTKAMVGLQLLKGEKEAALLGLSLLEEKPSTGGDSFITLAKTMAQGNLLSDDFEPGDMLELKLWLKGRDIKTLPEKFLPTVLESKDFKALDAKDKLLLAEEAFKKGKLSVEKLKAIYQEHGHEEKPLILPPKPSAQAVTLPPVPFDWEKNDPIVRAQLYTKIHETTDIPQKALLISQLIQHTLKYELHHLGHVILDHIKTLSPEEALRGHAPFFVQVLLHHHEQDLAIKWLSLVSLTEKKSMAPFILIMVDNLSLETKQKLFSHWYEESHAEKKDPQKVLMVLGTFEAIVPGITAYRGASLPHPQETSHLGSHALLWQLQFALSQQKGMALVYTLILAKEVLKTEHDSLLPYVVYALKTLGYDKEAKTLALQTILKHS